ncbi:murein transglycosylase A [Rhizorhapis sp. SPR117]|uniref:murein transglycosylase A n=1 Tax=Rhizorhapis sp. SPR117 TaxID=2912611 RepID=UPI001F01298F|nr:MltA domain-containing protein [Rhizorhapis sp. SPR117]
MSFFRSGVALCIALGLAACAGVVPTGTPRGTPPASTPTTGAPAARPVPATPGATLPAGPALPNATSAIELGIVPGPGTASLPFAPAQTKVALQAFRVSCPSLVRRTDQSGLTRAADWQDACTAAAGWQDDDAAGFFARYFETVQVGDGAAFATGYFEPEIRASRTRQPGYDTPIYRRPPDLVDVDLGLFSDDLKGKKIRGKVQGAAFVPFDDRPAIEAGALAGRGLEIAWAADPVEFFFLQVQGSGRLRLPDGSIMRIGYASQNGRDYTGIGKLMKDRGLLGPGQTSMQGIMDYLRSHPDEGKAIMNENKSFVFFRELNGAGPVGAMGVPVTAHASVAADPKFVPLGAPVLLSLDRAEPNGVWIAQDTGGAIKGANRFDTFWGAGDQARAVAGGMSARGSALLLLPKGSYARLMQSNGASSPQP